MQRALSTRPDLFELIRELDISPTDYARAAESFAAVKEWLEQGFPQSYPESDAGPQVYPQGSYRLGTIIRPLRDGKDVDFDLDMVCELQASKERIRPAEVKAQIGQRLRSHGVYGGKLDKEGKRCWTMNYRHKSGVSYHLDILPCVPDSRAGLDILIRYYSTKSAADLYGTTVALTHTKENSYEWRTSNPKGYASWFFQRNGYMFEQVKEIQKRSISEAHPDLYRSVSDVPNGLVRTPLQRAVQILKRHRDVRFEGRDEAAYKPISVIITTLAAQLYANELDVFDAVQSIATKLSMHAELMKGPRITLPENVAVLRLIARTPDGRWYIPNPVNPGENFADKWHEDANARAKAFFQWVDWVVADLVEPATTSAAEESVSKALGIGRSRTIVRPSGKPRPTASIVAPRPARPWGQSWTD